MRLDRAGVARLTCSSIFDVTNRTRQETMPAILRKRAPLQRKLSCTRGIRRRERFGKPAPERVFVREISGFVGKRQQQLLPGAQMGHLDVDRAVRQHALGDTEWQRATEVACEQFAA